MLRQIYVSLILAISEIKNTSVLTNLLIIFVMVLTFLNLIFGRGILTGLPEGSIQNYKQTYTGDILITNLDNQSYIKNPERIKNIINNSNYVKDYNVRYVSNMFVTSDYKKKENDKTNIFIQVVLTDIQKEQQYFKFNNLLKYGTYTNYSSIVGNDLLDEYTTTAGIGDATIKNARLGDKIQITNNKKSTKVEISAILKSKVRQVERRIYLNKNDYEYLIGKNYKDTAKEISIILQPNITADQFKNILETKNVNKLASIKTAKEAQPSFINDVKGTFSILGNIIGGIGLFISCVTIFIIIYVNAVNKRREIGILKGIGISPFVIILSFIFQALFYSLIGSIIGVVLLYGYIVPYFYANPLDFPFADGVLLAPINEVIVRFVILVVASIISGFIPAFLITKQKTINAILMR